MGSISRILPPKHVWPVRVARHYGLVSGKRTYPANLDEGADPLGAARGTVLAVVLSCVLWMVIMGVLL